MKWRFMAAMEALTSGLVQERGLERQSRRSTPRYVKYPGDFEQGVAGRLGEKLNEVPGRSEAWEIGKPPVCQGRPRRSFISKVRHCRVKTGG